MDLLFVLIAVCPAVIVTRYELKEEKVSWRLFLMKFAGWFYGMTFVNFILLYLQGMGSFDFSVLSVQFLAEYMVKSIAVAMLVLAGKRIYGNILHEEKAQEGTCGSISHESKAQKGTYGSILHEGKTQKGR